MPVRLEEALAVSPAVGQGAITDVQTAVFATIIRRTGAVIVLVQIMACCTVFAGGRVTEVVGT